MENTNRSYCSDALMKLKSVNGVQQIKKTEDFKDNVPIISTLNNTKI